MKKFKPIILVLGVVIIFSAALSAHAEIYVYTDADGTLQFTNVPTNNKFKPMRNFKDNSGITRRTFKKSGAVPSQVAQHRGDVSGLIIAKDMEQYMPTIEDASKKYRIPISLIKAIIYAESAWDKGAVSPAGACGLMQLMPDTAKELGVTDIFDPYQNIMGGTLHLRRLANMFKGDVVLMVAAYNAGHNLVANVRKVPNIPETRDYVKKVVKMYRRFRQEELARADIN